MQPATLTIEEVSKEYTTRSEPLRVLQGVSFSLRRGEAMAIMGPSGSGKSTLLHILGTLERPTSGSVRLNDVDPFALPDRELASFRNERVGFVFQDHHLLPQCSALENVLVPSIPKRSDNGSIEQRARELLQRVGLAARVDHRPGELSGGERQRVAIARAFINEPTLILADEPTGNLDRHTAQAIAEMFVELQRSSGTLMVIVTHSAELAARFPRQAELLGGTLRDVSN